MPAQRALDITSVGTPAGVPQLDRIGWEHRDADRYRMHPGRWPHRQITIQFTMAGCGAVWSDGAITHVPIGSVLLFDNRIHTRLQYGLPAPDAGWTFIYVNLSSDTAAAVVAALAAAHGHVIAIEDRGKLRQQLELLLPENGVSHRAWPWRESMAMALDVLSACSRGRIREQAPVLNEHHDLISRACAMLTERYFEGWSVTRLASEMGVTREHLSRVFVASVGEPPARWLRRRRIEEACRRLRGAASIGEVAESCGFADANTFTRTFRAELGMSPSEYRGRRPDELRPSESLLHPRKSRNVRRPPT